MLFNKFRVFLSASIPDPKRDERFRLINDAQFQIEEAVITLARAVFAHHGQLVFGGHPTITRIIASVAAEFDIITDAESREKSEMAARPLVLYQSEIFRGRTPEELELLEGQGYTMVVWVNTAEGEKYTVEKPNGKDYPHSMTLFRETMLGSPLDAMVCIGGMEGVINEVELFNELRKGKKVYLLPSTDGATRLIAENEDGSKLINRNSLKAYDAAEFKKYTDEFVSQLSTGTDKENSSRIEFNYDPYALLTALIVNDITGGEEFIRNSKQ